jgi:3-methyladenine DNA glycosylase/8-oxoguanine DNA glycosylase
MSKAPWLRTLREPAASVKLQTRAPFHLQATVRVLQRRPSNRVDVWQDDRYMRVLEIEKRLCLVEVANRGTIDVPDVRYCIRSGDLSAAVTAPLRRVLGLDVVPEFLQFPLQIDGPLRSTVIALRGMRPPRFANLFESFVNVVPFQQLSLDAGVSIVGRLVQRFGLSVEHGGRQYHASPGACVIAAARLDRLRACGLSRGKAQTLRTLARMIEARELSEEDLSQMTSQQAMHALTELPGIGPWSAALVLLRGFGRLDVFPPGDVGAARGVGALLQLDQLTSIDRAVERFGDRRGYLYFCGLGSSLLARGLIDAAAAEQRRGRY